MPIWLEPSTGLVVGHELSGPGDAPGVLGRALRAALDQPLAGAPRRPERLRVADGALADEVRAAVGDEFPIEVAPTPELDDLLERMLDSMPPDEGAGYLDGGRIRPELMARLFAAARVLYRLRPWDSAGDAQVIRMDIPALGVEGACLSIIGALGESRGVLIFPSLSGFDAFLLAARDLPAKGRRMDLGTDWLALNFERGASLSPAMRREVASLGWPVAGADAYPIVERFERDGLVRPVVERDIEIVAACAESLAAFVVKHRGLFDAEDPEPVSESYFDDNDLEVRFTAPYEASPLFGLPEAAGASASSASGTPVASTTPFRPRVSRNAPCPCGSGRKSKKCHLPLDEAAHAQDDERSPLMDLDEQMVQSLMQFAVRHFGARLDPCLRDFRDAKETAQLAVPWSLYVFRVDGRTVLEAFMDEHGGRATQGERAWIEAQRAAWLSVWEVTAVEPGRTLSLRDLFSGETRSVGESTASETLVKRDALLARVVDHDGGSLLDGVHPCPLAPAAAADVVRRARQRLRRRGAVPVERLRDEAFGRYLIRRWEDAVVEADRRAAIPPVLTNTGGDPFLLTFAQFDIAPGEELSVEQQLGALADVTPPEPGDDPRVFTFVRPANRASAPAQRCSQIDSLEDTIIGLARISGTSLRLETNSVARADALRKRIEAACGARIVHRERGHEDPFSRKRRSPPPRRRPGTVERDARRKAPPPEVQQLILDHKRRYYADWADQAVPALEGRTPRQAAATKSGRDAVDLLLRDMENREQRVTDGTAFDFSVLRRELGLE